MLACCSLVFIYFSFHEWHSSAGLPISRYSCGAELPRDDLTSCLVVLTAAGCPQAQKVYVQQRLGEAGEQIWGLLQKGAHFYVCGDAASMAGCVEQALLDIIAQHVVRSLSASHITSQLSGMPLAGHEDHLAGCTADVEMPQNSADSAALWLSNACSLDRPGMPMPCTQVIHSRNVASWGLAEDV